MKKATIFLIIFCLIIAGVFGYIYYNTPKTDLSKEISNISLSAEFNNNKIITGYVIETVDGKFYGNTSQSYEKIKVRRDQVIKIYNKNLEGQNFYTDFKEVEIKKDVVRIDLKLEVPKEIIVEKIRSNPIIVNLKSQDAREVDFCLKWSLNYIFVEANNFTEMKLDDYNDWKCYAANFSLINSNKTIEIKHTKFGTPSSEDYINLLLIRGVEPKTKKIVKIL